MGRYDKDIEENPYLGEHSKFTMQFARDHGITMEEAYKHPVVKAHKEDLRHLTECYKFANGNMRLNYHLIFSNGEGIPNSLNFCSA